MEEDILSFLLFSCNFKYASTDLLLISHDVKRENTQYNSISSCSVEFFLCLFWRLHCYNKEGLSFFPSVLI